MSASMLHEANITALPAEYDGDLESIIMVIGEQTSCVHYDEGEYDSIELILYRNGEKFPRLSLQS